MRIPHRRSVLRAALGSAATLVLAGCEPISGKPWVKSIIGLGEDINLRVQRALLGSGTLAPEYTEADLSPIFKPNGTSDPQDKDYLALAKKVEAEPCDRGRLARRQLDALCQRQAIVPDMLKHQARDRFERR